ncbi:ATP-binding cassette domain-containing protein [Yinghuangia sp. ASG 101]|uniref:ATP-binding cassette domain-containing protein n=1 Tax=Yinghuangia sp. ASG 101 TaxID=2896848 RepID=UPI001E52F28F|nr:ATP-binding cassette domain-containing protein [Yinghuangia sp. ASG 101]UGQ10834.1 ATP-binding cassette domain-containing protein [Yinghuangia sp. ASG 101]
MTDDFGWLAALAEELRRRGLLPEQVGQVVDEAAAHLRDSGEPAASVFGAADRYAEAVADSLGHPATRGLPRARPGGPLRLSARGIGKRHGRRHVLRGVDLDVRAGEVAAVVGANGCGKSTFLRICAGIASPDTGHVAVDGSVGYCPQDAGTSDFLSSDEHFVLVGAGRGLSRARSRDDGRGHARSLRWAQPDPVAAGHLSGGTRQKLNVVLAALGDPDILLLDEPYQGFDRGSYLDFWERIWRWRDAGKAVVVVTHLLDRLDRVDTVLDLTETAAPSGTRTAARRAGKGRGGR